MACTPFFNPVTNEALCVRDSAHSDFYNKQHLRECCLNKRSIGCNPRTNNTGRLTTYCVNRMSELCRNNINDENCKMINDRSAYFDILSNFCRHNINNSICASLGSNINVNHHKKDFEKQLDEYCFKNPKNLKKNICKLYCNNPENADFCIPRLKKICRNKMNHTFYKNICPCYFEQSFYDNMVRRYMPNLFNTINRRADCIFTNCKNSLYRSLISRPRCSNINNNSCVMEYSQDLSDSINNTSRTTLNCSINLNTNQIDKNNTYDNIDAGSNEDSIRSDKNYNTYILVILFIIIITIISIALIV